MLAVIYDIRSNHIYTMTTKVTGNVVIILLILTGCETSGYKADDLQIQQQLDSIASVSIDSAYREIQKQCDSNVKYKLPVLVDSLLKVDSTK
jgi:hypothetical protein